MNKLRVWFNVVSKAGKERKRKRLLEACRWLNKAEKGD